MIKRLSAYWLPEGTDPDEFWRYHTQVHAADVVERAGPALKKYTISRILKTVSGEQSKPEMFAVIEMWWESEEAMNEAFKVIQASKLPNEKTIWDDFWSRVAGGFSTVTEEFVAKDIT